MYISASTRSQNWLLASTMLLPIVACDPQDDGSGAGEPDPVVVSLPTPLTLELDIAEDMSRFAFDAQHVFEDGMPAYGNAFVTQGYVYPAGHLDGAPGTRADGSPADPDAVLGEWSCRGVFVGDGFQTRTGPLVITSQTVALYETPGWAPDKASGFATIVTEGYELIDVGVPVVRAVTGGTGDFIASSGELTQTLLGFNDSLGVNIRQSFELYAPLAGDLGWMP